MDLSGLIWLLLSAASVVVSVGLVVLFAIAVMDDRYGSP
jgi:hypothetical protein